MPTSTYTPIATTTITGSSTTTYTFSSIPNTYTDLVIVANVKYTVADTDFQLQLNGDTGTNYSYTILQGTGSSAGSYRASNSSVIEAGAYGYPGTDWNTTRIHFQNYSNTTTYKTIFSRADSSSGNVRAIVGLWRSTAAINSITLLLPSYLSPVYVSGSTFTLYGIKAA